MFCNETSPGQHLAGGICCIHISLVQMNAPEDHIFCASAKSQFKPSACLFFSTLQSSTVQNSDRFHLLINAS